MRRRKAFTLVELLVSLALIVFIMAILSYAFSAATRSFTDLKAAGDLAERLRAAVTLLRRDLAADHFEGKKRLSDPNFWDNGPPAEGFFRIWQTTPAATVNEGTEPGGTLSSYRSTGTMLHFAVKLRGNLERDYFAGFVPDNSPLATLGQFESRYQDGSPVYKSQWAEVAYWLQPALSASTGGPDTANGQPLYTLYRRQLLAVPDNNKPTVAYSAPGNAFPYLELSAQPGRNDNGNFSFNGPRDLTIPARRFGMSPNAPSATKPFGAEYAGLPLGAAPDYFYPTMGADNTNFANADVALNDVVSCDVRILLAGGTDFVTLFDPSVAAHSNGNPSFAYAAGTPQKPAVFDTWSAATDDVYDYSARDNYATTGATTPRWALPNTNASVPLYRNAAGQAIRIRAIQISIRVWDPKTQLTRQVTLVQDL
jgi:prepilin-type N-terminal cleavage/methylation domain-containing protein